MPTGVVWIDSRTGSRELFTLCVVAAAVGIAFGATALFGVSFALGAFFAGMVMRESEFSHRAAQESLPLRDAFAVLFFVSVGMLFDPSIVLREPLTCDEVKAFVEEHVAHYKRLRHVVFADAIPKSPSGKILRRLLRT